MNLEQQYNYYYWNPRTVTISSSGIISRKHNFNGITRLLIEEPNHSVVISSLLKNLCYNEPIKLLKDIIIPNEKKIKKKRRPLGKRSIIFSSSPQEMPMRDVKYVEFTGSPKIITTYSQSIRMPQVENVCFSCLSIEKTSDSSTHDAIYKDAVSRCFPACNKLILKSKKKIFRDQNYFEPEEGCYESRCRRNYLTETIWMLQSTGRKMDIEIDDTMTSFMYLPAILGDDYDGVWGSKGPLGDWKDLLGKGTLYVCMGSINHGENSSSSRVIMSFPGYCCSSRENSDLRSGVSLTLKDSKNSFIRYNSVCEGCSRVLSSDKEDFCG